jgi:transcriptional regulator with XRE-family HTH domain
MKDAHDYLLEERNKPAYWFEKSKTDFSDKIYQLMMEHNMSRSQLAGKVGVTKPYISKVFAGNENFTIRTMSNLAFALGCELCIDFSPIEKDAGIPQKLDCISSNYVLGKQLPFIWSTQSQDKSSVLDNEKTDTDIDSDNQLIAA